MESVNVTVPAGTKITEAVYRALCRALDRAYWRQPTLPPVIYVNSASVAYLYLIPARGK